MRYPIASKYCPMCNKIGHKRNPYINQIRCYDCKISYGDMIYIFMNGFEKPSTHTVSNDGSLYRCGNWKLCLNIKNYNTLKESLDAILKIEVFG